MEINIEPETEGEQVLANAVEQLSDELEDLAAENTRLRQRVAELEDEIEDTRDDLATEHTRVQNLKNRIHGRDSRVDDLEDEIEDTRDELGDEIESVRDAVSHSIRELEGVKDRLREGGDLAEAASDSAAESSGPSGPEPETPLQRLVALPDATAEDALGTRLDERARWTASRIMSIGHSVGVGWAINAGDLGRHLKSSDRNGHPQTVKRIMLAIEDLGGENVELRYTDSGEKQLIFRASVETRLDEIASERQRTDRGVHDVMNPVEN